LKLALHVVIIELSCLLLRDGRDVRICVLTSLEFLLDSNERVDTVDEHLDELEFREAKSVSVRDVKHATFGGGVDAASSALLESELAEKIVEFSMLGELFELHVNASSDTSSKIGWAGKNVSKMLAVHEISAGFLDVSFELVKSIDPSFPASLHITIFLHRNDSEMVFFVDPDQKVFLVVVPDTSGIGPVSGHTSGGKKWRNRLVKEEVISNQLLLRGVGHFIKGEVLAFKIAVESIKSAKRDALNLSSLSSRAPWRKSISSDGSAGSDSDGENVVGIKGLLHDEAVGKVGLVRIGGLVSTVSGFDDLVEKLGKGFVRVLVTSNAADGHDEGVARVVDAGLDGIVDGEARFGLSRSHSLVQLGGHDF